MTGVTIAGIQFEVAAFSEQGPRPENQDAYDIEHFPATGLLGLADGMGGEKSGRAAADIALETLSDRAPIRSVDEARRAVRSADEAVSSAALSDPDRFGGMGCALGVLSLVDGSDGVAWLAAHVGDVRILSRSPDGVLRLETRDHTPAFGRWEAGEIGLDEIPDTVGANRLQRAIGRGGEPDVVRLPAAPGWTWLIVSDGVSKAMRLDELADAMTAATADGVCEVMRRRVGKRGADDNYTAVVVRALDGPPMRAALPDPTTSEMVTSPAGRSPRHGLTILAVIAALIAIALAGLALSRASAIATERGEIARLRTEVDSLRSLVEDLFVDPFGPTAPDPPTTQPTPGLP